MEPDDRIEIDRLVSALGRCLDERDFDGLRDLFTGDAEVHTPGGVARGHDALVEQARRRHTAPAGIQHVITNLLVTETAVDAAEVRANLLVAFADAGPADPTPFLLGEVYRFTMARTRDGWRMSRMTSSPVWTLNRPPELTLKR
jgi:3-phenylpropionate/cinnamic acid dioxygenase small subunit